MSYPAACCSFLRNQWSSNSSHCIAQCQEPTSKRPSENAPHPQSSLRPTKIDRERNTRHFSNLLIALLCLLAAGTQAQVILTIVEAPHITSAVLGRVQPGDAYTEFRGANPVFSHTGVDRRVDLTFTTVIGQSYVVESIAESPVQQICNYTNVSIRNEWGVVVTQIWLTVTYYQWIPVSPPMMATGSVMAWRQGAFGTNRFYRIKKL